MREDGPGDRTSLSSTQVDLVDQVRGEFESAWRSGDQPQIEAYLAGRDEAVWPALLRELMAIEVGLRRDRGERPDPHEYRERFPGQESLTLSAFTEDRPAEGRAVRERGADTEAATRLGTGRPVAGDEATTVDGNLAPRVVPIVEIPGYEIQEEIGRGGMGVVYRAVQCNLGCPVALKILPLAFASDPERLQRFRNEASIAANLRDARVVPVTDIKESGGTLVLIMPFVEGCDLSKIIDDRKKALRDGAESSDSFHRYSTLQERNYLASILALLDQAVDAVAAIHEAGVIHRDIKPSNILVDRHGQIRITDFGLARLGREAVITSAGSTMGTHGYMSPEQWDGREDIDGRADLFSLGATIHQAVTLELPFGKRRITARDPRPARPSKRRPRLSSDLDAVILKALEPDRDQRYGSAAELQDDWRRARAGLLPKATRPRPIRHLARWVRQRSRTLATTGITSVLLAVAGTFLVPWRPTPAESRPRTVEVVTKPPGARFVLVPIDDQDGEPRPERLIRPDRGATTPARLPIRPGDYLVVVAWPDDRFHEVYRHVPKPGELPGALRHTRWYERPGSIQLPEVEIPPPSVLDRMAYFEGKEGIAIGASKPRLSLRGRNVPPFYLDRHEVTVRDFLKVTSGLMTSSRYQMNGPDDAVRYVSWDEATHAIERMGKRLPTDAEYEFAATRGGTQPFPGADPAPYLANEDWRFGPVESPDYDQTDTKPPVFGLYSNVAEWTSSWMIPTPGYQRDALPENPSRLRIIRGGPPSVVQGRPNPSEFATGLKSRVAKRRGSDWPPGVGFRGARSARPRFLDDAEPATAQ